MVISYHGSEAKREQLDHTGALYLKARLFNVKVIRTL
jgi:hypothetical protein